LEFIAELNNVTGCNIFQPTRNSASSSLMQAVSGPLRFDYVARSVFSRAFSKPAVKQLKTYSKLGVIYGHVVESRHRQTWRVPLMLPAGARYPMMSAKMRDAKLAR